MAHVLMVDSDRLLTNVYAKCVLEAGHTVTARYDVNGADAFLEEALAKHRLPEVVTLGVMMPTGGLFTEEEADNGLRTGVLFYHRMREVHGYRGPVIVLTHVASDVVRNSFEAVGCVYAVKEETYPPKLVEIVEQCTRPKNPVSFLYQTLLRWKEGHPVFVVRKPTIQLSNANW